MQPAAPTIHAFTFKDGLFARLAHDLRLSLRRFEIHREGDALRGRFWLDSLVADGAVARGGALDSDALSAGDRAKIQRNIADEILHTARHPEATFTGALADGGRAVAGELTMSGRTCPVRAQVQRQGGRLRAEFTLEPSRWGIAPYKAIGGAIKLQDRVVVALDLPEASDPATWTGEG